MSERQAQLEAMLDSAYDSPDAGRLHLLMPDARAAIVEVMMKHFADWPWQDIFQVMISLYFLQVSSVHQARPWLEQIHAANSASPATRTWIDRVLGEFKAAPETAPWRGDGWSIAHIRAFTGSPLYLPYTSDKWSARPNPLSKSPLVPNFRTSIQDHQIAFEANFSGTSTTVIKVAHSFGVSPDNVAECRRQWRALLDDFFKMAWPDVAPHETAARLNPGEVGNVTADLDGRRFNLVSGVDGSYRGEPSTAFLVASVSPI